MGEENKIPPISNPISKMALALLFAGFILWILFPYLSRFNLDMYGDMLENYAWGTHWQLGNSKHPPMFGWIVALWFEIFPRNDFFYRALGSLNVAVAVGFSIFIARRFFTPAQQSLIVSFGMILPLLWYQGTVYNANSAMLPFWAAGLLFYLRVIEQRRIVDAAILGLIAAGAMLAKYYSAVFLTALLLHALTHKETRDIVFSRLGLICAAVFILGVLPHIYWLIGHNFSPVHFAYAQQGETSLGNIAYRQMEFFIAQILYAVPILAIAGLYRFPPDGAPLFDIAQFLRIFSTVKGSAVLWSGLGVIPITMIFGLIAWSPLTSNWSVPLYVFIPLITLGLLPQRVLTPAIVRRSIPIMIVFASLLMIIAPYEKARALKAGRFSDPEPLRHIAQKIEQMWHDNTNLELRYVFGAPAQLSRGVSFYSKAGPLALQSLNFASQPWIDQNDIMKNGYLVVCWQAGCPYSKPLNGWTATQIGIAEVPAPKGVTIQETYKAYMWKLTPTPES